MKRFALGLGVVSLCGYGLASSLAACGGDDDATVPDADGGNTSSTSSGSSSGSTTSSGGSSGTTTSSGGSSSGGTNDGGTDAAADGSAPVTSNPNKVTCGTAECTSGTQVCCRTFTDAGCIGSGDNCQGIKAECDEKADCTGTDICCGNAFQGTYRCDPSCKGGGSFQTCKTNAECASGTCKEYTCPGNTKFRSCTALQGCQ